MYKACYLAFCLLITTTIFSQTPTDNTVSQPFPFEVTLLTPDSVAATSAKILGKEKKVTVLAFWLTTCYPCMVELETYKQNYPAWKKEADFNFFAITTDFSKNFGQVKRVVNEKKWPFPAYWDRERKFKEILPGGLNGLPQVFIFDAKGQLVWRHKGFKPGDEVELFAQIKAASK